MKKLLLDWKFNSGLKYYLLDWKMINWVEKLIIRLKIHYWIGQKAMHQGLTTVERLFNDIFRPEIDVISNTWFSELSECKLSMVLSKEIVFQPRLELIWWLDWSHYLFILLIGQGNSHT